MKFNYIYTLALILGVVFFACKKDEVVPVNPYSLLEYSSEDTTVVDTLNKNELASIHEEIFLPKCGFPGCHDGTFEPNFTTISASYSSLVYHPVIKNNAGETFKYRVTPKSAENSVLYERLTNCCFVNTNDRMPQSSIGVALPEGDIARIKTWIDNGAKDVAGNITEEPNSEPVFQYVYAIIDSGFPLKYDTRVVSHDTNRVGGLFYGAMMLDTNMSIVLMSEIKDDKTSIDQLKNGKLLFSYDKDDFSNPLMTVSSVFLNANGGFWYNVFSTTVFPENKEVYMRYYVNDGDHTIDTEFPTNASLDYFKGHWSFVVIKGSNTK